MDKQATADAIKEWKQILEDHPRFARAFVAQQLILIEASEQQDIRLVRLNMCKLIEMGFVFPFLDYWLSHCRPRIPVSSTIKCLASDRDPADCLSIPQEDVWGWFKDPFAGGHLGVPPKPGPGPIA